MDGGIVKLEASLLAYVNQPKELVTSLSYHAVITTIFFVRVNRMAK
jgi:hypothetical protein